MILPAMILLNQNFGKIMAGKIMKTKALTCYDQLVITTKRGSDCGPVPKFKSELPVIPIRHRLMSRPTHQQIGRSENSKPQRIEITERYKSFRPLANLAKPRMLKALREAASEMP